MVVTIQFFKVDKKYVQVCVFRIAGEIRSNYWRRTIAERHATYATANQQPPTQDDINNLVM